MQNSEIIPWSWPWARKKKMRIKKMLLRLRIITKDSQPGFYYHKELEQFRASLAKAKFPRL